MHGLGEQDDVKDAINLLFKAMSEFRLGKSSTVFYNEARSLGHIVLSNKKEQARFTFI